MNRLLTCGAAVSVFAVIVSGCAANAADDAGSNSAVMAHENVDRVSQPIINGITSGTDRDSVVVLATFLGGVRKSLCTATLVAPNLILTARHCVSDTDSQTACAMDGSPVAGSVVHADRTPSMLAIFVGKDGVGPDSASEANAAAHGTKLVVDSATSVCNKDIAFLVLDKKLTETPVAQIRVGSPLLPEKLDAIGWGVDQTGKLPATRLERHDIPLIGLGPGLYPENQAYGYGNAEFMLGESACAGDSGGPAFAASGAVVGVAARAGNGKAKDPNNMASVCTGDTAHVVYTHLGYSKDLVQRAFSEAGEPAWLEGQPDPRAAKPSSPSSNNGNGGTTKGTTNNAESTKTTKSAEGQDIPLPNNGAKSPSESEEDGGPLGLGCSMSSEPQPQSNSVEYAMGLVALIASVIGLRRRFGKKREDEEESEPRSMRERLPSMP